MISVPTVSSRLSIAGLLVLLALLVAVPASAQNDPPPNEPCGDLTRQCAEMTDDELYAAAVLTSTGASLGTCYVYDAGSCTSCACPYYVKLSWEDGSKGYDGGTGCLHSQQDVIAVLRSLCATGQCGCPTNSNPSPTCLQVVTWGKDPLTGTCCQYPNPCLVPDGWATFYTQQDCENA